MNLEELQDETLKLQAKLGAIQGKNAANLYLAAYSQSFENTLLAEAEGLKTQLDASVEKLIETRKKLYAEMLTTATTKLCELDKTFFENWNTLLEEHDKLFSSAFKEFVEIQNKHSQELIEQLSRINH